MSDPREEPVAKAIYMTHWNPPAPTWDDARTAARRWVTAQAKSALAVIDAAAPVRIDFDDEIAL